MKTLAQGRGLWVTETAGIDRRAIHEQRESENPAPSTKQKHRSPITAN
ncbi:MAG: hypothetical protein QMC23_05390 [Rubritalea sp.]